MLILKIIIQILTILITGICWYRVGEIAGKRKGKEDVRKMMSHELSLREAICILADIDELIVVDMPCYVHATAAVEITYDEKSIQGLYNENEGIRLIKNAMNLVVKSHRKIRFSNRQDSLKKCDFLAEKIAEKGNSIEAIRMSGDFKKLLEKRFGITGNYIDPLGKAIKIKDLPNDFEIIFKDESKEG